MMIVKIFSVVIILLLAGAGILFQITVKDKYNQELEGKAYCAKLELIYFQGKCFKGAYIERAKDA